MKEERRQGGRETENEEDKKDKVRQRESVKAVKLQ